MGNGVNLSALASKRPATTGDLTLGDPGVLIVDRVALRKSWSREPTYWLDILADAHGTFQVRKSWRWGNGSDRKQGFSRGSKLLRRPDTVAEAYQANVERQIIEKDYVIVERQVLNNTPAATLDLCVHGAHTVACVDAIRLEGLDDDTPAIMDTRPAKTKAPLLARKPERDWW